MSVDESQYEEDGEDIHDGGEVFLSSGEKLDDDIGYHAECNAFGDAGGEGHGESGDEARNGFGGVG